MKEGWTYKKLGEVCNIDFGTRVVRSRDAGSIYPVYGGGGATFKMDTYNREDCMVISRFGMSEQCTRFVKGKFFLNDSGLTLSMKKDCMIQGFMDWQIVYLNNTIYSLGRGAAQKNLDTKALAEVVIVYPNNLSEQLSIVSRLDAAFAHIDSLKANVEKQLAEARQLFQAELAECMRPKEGWEEKTLPDISENLDSIRIPVTKKNRTEGKYPYYGASGIVDYVDDYLFDEDLLCISEDGANLLMRTYPIAFPISGKVWVNNHAHVLRFKSLITQKYVEYYFSGLKLDEYITGAAQPKLTQKALNSIIINIPKTIDIQRSIVSRLNALSANIKKLEEVQRKTLAECDALKQAMLREVFE